tara:strand:- start:455 stop:658 length:204 start_codon:yes stop_codon:yes gene_type:complete
MPCCGELFDHSEVTPSAVGSFAERWAMPGLPDWRVAPAHGHDLGAAWLDPLWSKAKKLTMHYSAPSP